MPKPKPIVITSAKLGPVNPPIQGKFSGAPVGGGVELLPGESEITRGIDVQALISKEVSTSRKSRKKKKSKGGGFALAAIIGGGLLAASRSRK